MRRRVKELNRTRTTNGKEQRSLNFVTSVTNDLCTRPIHEKGFTTPLVTPKGEGKKRRDDL